MRANNQLMEQQDKTVVATIGLHRPFNMPLKSLVWVCRFCKGYDAKKGRDLYIEFFLWMLRSILDHADDYDEQKAEGIVKTQNARVIMDLLCSCSYEDIKSRVRSTLTKRKTDEDKVIYSNYKNTSYYITLAKKVKLVNGRGKLSPLGEKLALVRDGRFFDLSYKHRLIIFSALCPEFFDKLIIITQGHRLVKGDKTLEDAFFRIFLKRSGNEGLIKYITSFNDNYLEVLRHWVETLKLCTSAGTVRRMYLEEIARLDLMEYYETLIRKTESFFEDEYKARVRQETQYQKIRDSYEYFEKHGLTDLGYVNLYDIKKGFRLSFETFNELLNSYYTQNRQKEIILFSNTVASIDQRRRFVVDGIAALKIRIIKKSLNGYKSTLDSFRADCC